MQMQDKTDRLIAKTAKQTECDDERAGLLRVESDVPPSKSSSQAGALAVHVPLSAGLTLLNKQQHGSPRASNSGRANDQQLLRPIVARFLESLPSIGKGWSFDTEGLHSVQNDDECSDNTSCCSCNSIQCPASAASSRPRLRQHAPQLHTGRRPAAAAATVDVNEGDSSSATTPVALAGEGIWSSGEGLQSPSTVPHNGASQPLQNWRFVGSKGAARCLEFATAESTGSAPTPSPRRCNTSSATAEQRRDAVACQTDDKNPCDGIGNAVRRGVFVGNLPGDVNERALVELFSRCGKIDSLWIARNAGTQTSLGYGFVVFDATSGLLAARCAEQLDGLLLQQHRICVRVSTRDF